jgi:hypothetical protein
VGTRSQGRNNWLGSSTDVLAKNRPPT